MDLNQNDYIETKRKCALYEQWNKKKYYKRKHWTEWNSYFNFSMKFDR